MNHLNKLIIKSLLEGCKSVRSGYNCNIAAINTLKNNQFTSVWLRQYCDGSPVRKPSDYPLKSFLDDEKQTPETDDGKSFDIELDGQGSRGHEKF